jgi:hypothetical protein
MDRVTNSTIADKSMAEKSTAMTLTIKLLGAMWLSLLTFQVHGEIRGEITEYGYYQQMGQMERERNFNTATGFVRTGTDVQLVQQTADIPMALGRLFGFKFRIRGFPRDAVTANLELAVSHPEIQRPNGTRISGYRFPVTLDVVGGKVESQSGYKFDKEYEMVAGEWKFQYWRGEQLMLEQTFNVYDPALLPTSETTTENPPADNPPAPVQESPAQSTAQPASQPSTKAVAPLY